MGKFERTRYILIACLDILLEEKQLLLFPLVSLACTGLVLLSFLPMWDPVVWHQIMSSHQGSYSSPGGAKNSAPELLKLFTFYYLNYFFIAFFNTGLTACAVRHMQGEKADFKEGFGVAIGLAHRIAGWALIAACVGTALKVIQSETRNPIGRILAGLFGMTFSISSYFVIPMMVVGDKGPIDAIVESAKLFKQTWGERFISALGFGAVFIILMLPGLVLVFLLGAIGVPGLALLALAGVYIVFCALVQSALETIFRAGLYTYATTGKAPDGFDAGELRSAFVPAKTGGAGF